ncbi:LYR motif-containing protein 2-like [Rhopilema esculentum]|uniref:LYR motif-containing protein 2-like n=1 Tax=Rhopilema esculentum TaxID=499914 RepID=UPI0031D1EF3D
MSRTRLPHNILDFKQFLLRRQVIYLYREVLKLIKEHKSLDQQRELKEWASYEFRSRKNLTDEGAVKMHLAKGRLAVKELAAAIRMAK